jgi:thiol-disulfide isomerase/thioredoxin
MNMMKSIRFSPPSSASIGGSLKSMATMKNIGILLFVVILALIAYFMYKNASAQNSDYKSNKEHISNSSGSTSSGSTSSGKEAEIIMFYTDWCPHCKTAKPEWEQVKAEFQGKQIKGYTIIFTEVNCTNESPDVEKMINTYKVEGYPTIKLIKDNQVIDYDAKPTKATLTQFLNTVI